MKRNKLLNKIRKEITPEIRDKVIKATKKKIEYNKKKDV
jgi:hypothetical protein